MNWLGLSYWLSRVEFPFDAGVVQAGQLVIKRARYREAVRH